MTLLAPAIASADGDQLANPSDPTAIVGGISTDEGELDAVVLLSTGAGNCSGTLIAPTVVLTAAHCLDDLHEDATVEVGFGRHGTYDAMTAERFEIHPRYCRYCEDEIYDYAYVVLPEAYLPNDGLLRPLVDSDEWQETMQVGKVVLLAGYGTDDPTGVASGVPEKRKVTATIGELSDNEQEFFAGGGGRDTCSGDSGGAAIVQLGSGALRLAGVTSRGSSPCGNGGWYGIPRSALEWVETSTGAQLMSVVCTDSDCFDDEPSDSEAGCRVGHSPRLGGWMWMVLVLISWRRGGRS